MCSYLAVPVVSRSGHVVGGLFFGHPEQGRFTAEHEKLAVGIAAYAAIAVDNALLYRAAQDEIERHKESETRRGSDDASRADDASRMASALAETKDALTQLRDSERNFRLLVQSVTDYAIYMLDPKGTVASWNAGRGAHQRLFGTRDRGQKLRRILYAGGPPGRSPRREHSGLRERKDATKAKAGVFARMEAGSGRWP